MPAPAGNGLGVSQVAGGWAVRIDTRVLRFNLMPGANESGGGLIRPSFISDDYRSHVIAAFNGGFQLKDSGGGFYLGGVTVQGLTGGAASLVIRTDGTATVGQWGRDLAMGPDVEGVLQNLHLIVDGGAPTDVSDGDTSRWGPTLGGTPYVPRAGVCVDGGGNLTWVGGPGLSSAGLARVMVAAGCTRGMELDINPQWVSFAIYDHHDPANPTNVSGRNLYGSMYYGPDSYFSPRGRNWVMLTAR